MIRRVPRRLIVQYKYTKSCAVDKLLQHLIICTKLCGIGSITQPGGPFQFHLTKIVRWKIFVPVRYQLPKDKSVGLVTGLSGAKATRVARGDVALRRRAPNIFTFMGRAASDLSQGGCLISMFHMCILSVKQVLASTIPTSYSPWPATRLHGLWQFQSLCPSR